MQTLFQENPPFLALQTELQTGTRYPFESGHHDIATAHVGLVLPDESGKYPISQKLNSTRDMERIDFFHALADQFEKLHAGSWQQAYALLVDIAEGGLQYHHQNDHGSEQDFSPAGGYCLFNRVEGGQAILQDILLRPPAKIRTKSQFGYYPLPLGPESRAMINLLSSAGVLHGQDFDQAYKNIFGIGCEFRRQALESGNQVNAE